MIISNHTEIEQNGIRDGFEWIDLEEVRPTQEALDLAPGDFALKFQVLPIEIRDGVLVAAIGAPESLSAVDDLGTLLQMPTKAVLAPAAQIREKIEEIFLEKILAGLPGQGDDSGLAVDDTTDLADLQKMAGETAVVQMVNLIFAQAVRDGASDIHIEPYERQTKIRYRVDGMLRDVMSPPAAGWTNTDRDCRTERRCSRQHHPDCLRRAHSYAYS